MPANPAAERNSKNLNGPCLDSHRASQPLPNATPFDTVAFIGGIERVAREAIAVFGRPPYHEYTFMFQDGAYGGLEHLNSVTLGAPSSALAEGQSALLEEMAHEFFHGWNLMRIRPAEEGGVDYRHAGRSRGLWFSEGLSIYYADLLLRRAKIRLADSTRVDHLRSVIGRYLNNSGSTSISPERVSLHAYDLRPILRSMRIGDRLSFETIRNGRPFRTTVVVRGFSGPQPLSKPFQTPPSDKSDFASGG